MNGNGCVALLGAAGVHALIVRSLKLTGAAPSSLADLDATAGPPRDHQEQLRRFLQDQGPAARDTAVGLFATFFALLATFVGDRLSTQVLARAWPDAFAPDARKDDT